jgi:ribulose kinase
MAHYIGLDVGTGSARACLIDEKGDILGVATKDIKTWHERADYYVSLDGAASNSGTINRRHLVGMLLRR